MASVCRNSWWRTSGMNWTREKSFNTSNTLSNCLTTLHLLFLHSFFSRLDPSEPLSDKNTDDNATCDDEKNGDDIETDAASDNKETAPSCQSENVSAHGGLGLRQRKTFQCNTANQWHLLSQISARWQPRRTALSKGWCWSLLTDVAVGQFFQDE